MRDFYKLAPYYVVIVFVIPFMAGVAKGRFPEHSGMVEVVKVLASVAAVFFLTRHAMQRRESGLTPPRKPGGKGEEGARGLPSGPPPSV